MNKKTITCAILCSDASLATQLTEYIAKTPYLQQPIVHSNPLDALNRYTKDKVNLYFVELDAPYEANDIDGIEFSRLLSEETRVVFIARNAQKAARCFRVDALDYLTELDISTFFQVVNKALRWFAHTSIAPAISSKGRDEWEEKILSIRSKSSIIRIRLDEILYIEGMGDYVKIHLQDVDTTHLTLSSMKQMEARLPHAMFIRIHSSFIVNKMRIKYIERSEVLVANKRLPVGDTYRDRLKQWVSELKIVEEKENKNESESIEFSPSPTSRQT
ncbi:MAG: LytR/AlgR family response regulator transcription factor [Bacteroides sp.]